MIIIIIPLQEFLSYGNLTRLTHQGNLVFCHIEIADVYNVMMNDKESIHLDI